MNLREKVSMKKTELKLNEQSIAYLAQLKSQLTSDKDKIGLYGGKAEFIPIANQVIEVQQVRTAGEADINEFKATEKTLHNSLFVLEKLNHGTRENTMIRALKEPVNVLFVLMTILMLTNRVSVFIPAPLQLSGAAKSAPLVNASAANSNYTPIFWQTNPWPVRGSEPD